MTRRSAKTDAACTGVPQPWQLRNAARRLHDGAVIAYPTEAVYGLGCDPLNADAVMRLLALKQRPMAAGLILVAADFSQAEPFLLPVPANTRRTIMATWPGPVTWLLPARPEAPAWLRGRHDSLAIRVTAHAGTAELCRHFGGVLVSTSANPRGHNPARSALQVRRYFGGRLDGVLPGPLGGLRKPSEIRDARTGRILRSG